MYHHVPSRDTDVVRHGTKNQVHHRCNVCYSTACLHWYPIETSSLQHLDQSLLDSYFLGLVLRESGHFNREFSFYQRLNSRVSLNAISRTIILGISEECLTIKHHEIRMESLSRNRYALLSGEKPQIRFLTLKPQSNAAGNFECQLESFPHHKTRPYTALSCCWAETASKVSKSSTVAG